MSLLLQHQSAMALGVAGPSIILSVMAATAATATSLNFNSASGQVASGKGRHRASRKAAYLSRETSGSDLSRAINFDYAGVESETTGSGAYNFNDNQDLSDNSMVSHYNQPNPKVHKFGQQHKNKKPVYVSINQQTVNGLLSLLLLFMISIFGSIGSIFLISALTVIESLQTRGNSYLVSLALGHLLVTAFVIPSSALQIMAADGINSKRLCHYQWLTLEFSLIVSHLSFFFIAVDNFLGYRSTEKLKITLAPTDRDTLSPEANNNPLDNGSNLIDWMAEARDFVDVSHNGHDSARVNQLMSKQSASSNRWTTISASMSALSNGCEQLLLTKQLVANQLPDCQKVELLKSPGQGSIGHGNCCGRLRILMWISLIWILAIGYTIHQHRLSYGPSFCQAPNKYKLTNSSSSSRSLQQSPSPVQPSAVMQLPPLVRSYLAKPQIDLSKSIHWDDGAIDTRIRRSAGDKLAGSSLQEPILLQPALSSRQLTDQLNFIAGSAGKQMNEGQDEGDGERLGPAITDEHSLEQSTTKSFANLGTFSDSHLIASGQLGRASQAKGGPTSGQGTGIHLSKGKREQPWSLPAPTLARADRGTNFDPGPAPNEVHRLAERANELDIGTKRPADNINAALVSIHADAAAAAAKRPVPARASGSNEKRPVKLITATEPALNGQPIQQPSGEEIIWRANSDSYHRNSRGSRTNNSKAAGLSSSSCVGVKQTGPSTCVTLPTVPMEESAAVGLEGPLAYSEGVDGKTMGPTDMGEEEAPAELERKVAQVPPAPPATLSALAISQKVISSTRSNSRPPRDRRSLQSNEEAGLSNWGPSKYVSIPPTAARDAASRPGQSPGESSVGVKSDMGAEQWPTAVEPANSKLERPAYFWHIMLGALIGPSLISGLLFARVYLRMREFRQRFLNPLSLASIKLYPLPTSVLAPTSIVIEMPVSQVPAPTKTTPIVIADKRQQSARELSGCSIRRTAERVRAEPAAAAGSDADFGSKPADCSSLIRSVQFNHQQQGRSLSQPADCRPPIQTADIGGLGFTRAEYVLALNPANWPPQNRDQPQQQQQQQHQHQHQQHQQQQLAHQAEDENQPADSLRQRLNQVLSVPLNGGDNNSAYSRRNQIHQRSTLAETLIESPPTSRLVQNVSYQMQQNQEPQQLVYHNHQQQPVNLSFSAPASATFIRWDQQTGGRDPFDPLLSLAGPAPVAQLMDGKQGIKGREQQALRAARRYEPDRQQYEFKRRRSHARSFHYGTRLQPAKGRPASSQQVVGPQTSQGRLATTCSGLAHLQQCLPELAGRQTPQGTSQQQQQLQQHSLERHCSLPSSSRLYQSETGHLHLHLPSAEERAAELALADGSKTRTGSSANQLIESQMQPLDAWPPSLAASNMAEISYDPRRNNKRLHRNRRASNSNEPKQEKKQHELAVVSEALANVIKPSLLHHHHQPPDHDHHHQSLSSRSSLTSDGAEADLQDAEAQLLAQQRLNLPGSDEQQEQPSGPIINSAASLQVTSQTGNAATRENGVGEKILIVCAYPNMIEDQLIKSNIVVFVLNFTLWLPFIIMSIVWQYRASLSEEFKDTAWWIATLNCCSCSYVYALTHRDFREAFNKLFYYCCCKSHVTFQRKTPIFRRQLDFDRNGNLRIRIIPGLNVYSNKLQLAATNLLAPNDHQHLGAPSRYNQHHAVHHTVQHQAGADFIHHPSHHRWEFDGGSPKAMDCDSPRGVPVAGPLTTTSGAEPEPVPSRPDAGGGQT